MQETEFQEIAHCGGKVTFIIRTALDGQKQYQVSVSTSRPNTAAFFTVYAIPQGVAVATIHIGGLGAPMDPPPIPGCYPVFIGSDSEGMFGFECPTCEGYWRAEDSRFCPYCGAQGESHQFLTKSQRRYVAHYCKVLNDAKDADDGDYTIDMDAVADATWNELERPPFYYSEQRRQNLFKCDACGAESDILGIYGYCTMCATRNDLQELKLSVGRLQKRVNEGGPYESHTKDAVGLFDSFVNQLSRLLLENVPMTPARRNKIEKRSLHDLPRVVDAFKSVFDIDLSSDLSEDDLKFAEKIFFRRHVYEHNGGEVDQQYIDQSRDTSVVLKQALREDQVSVHRVITITLKMATNLHRGFHQLIPPEPEPIRRHAEYKKQLSQRF